MGTYTFDLTSGKTGARFTYTLTKQADGSGRFCITIEAGG